MRWLRLVCHIALMAVVVGFICAYIYHDWLYAIMGIVVCLGLGSCVATIAVALQTFTGSDHSLEKYS